MQKIRLKNQNKATNQKPPNKTHKQQTNKKSRKKLEDISSAENSRVFSRKFLKRAKQLPADADKLVVFTKKKTGLSKYHKISQR